MRWIVPSNRESLFGRPGVFRIGSWSFVMTPRTEVRPPLGLTEKTPHGPEISLDRLDFPEGGSPYPAR